MRYGNDEDRAEAARLRWEEKHEGDEVEEEEDWDEKHPLSCTDECECQSGVSGATCEVCA